MKGAVVKTQASTGGKINKGGSAGKKGRHESTSRYRGNAWPMSVCVCVCSWLMTTGMSWNWWTGKNWGGGNTNNLLQSLHCEANLVRFVPTRSLSRKNRYEPRPNFHWFLGLAQFSTVPLLTHINERLSLFTTSCFFVNVPSNERHTENILRIFFPTSPHKLKDNKLLFEFNTMQQIIFRQLMLECYKFAGLQEQ